MPQVFPDTNFPNQAACEGTGGDWTAQGCRTNMDYSEAEAAQMRAGRSQYAGGTVSQAALQANCRAQGGTLQADNTCNTATAPAPAAFRDTSGDWTAQNTTSVIGTGVQALLGGIGLGLQADAASQQRRFQQAQLEMQNQLAQRNLQFQQAQLAAAAAVPGSAEATQATAVAQQIAQQMVLVQQQMAAAVAARNAAATGPSAGTIALVAGGVAVAGLLLLVVTRRNDPAPRYNPSRRRR